MYIPLPRLRLLLAELHTYTRYASLHNHVSLFLIEWLQCVARGTFEQPDHSPCWLAKHGAFVGRSLLLGGHYFGEGVDFALGCNFVFDTDRELNSCVSWRDV